MRTHRHASENRRALLHLAEISAGTSLTCRYMPLQLLNTGTCGWFEVSEVTVGGAAQARGQCDTCHRHASQCGHGSVCQPLRVRRPFTCTRGTWEHLNESLLRWKARPRERGADEAPYHEPSTSRPPRPVWSMAVCSAAGLPDTSMLTSGTPVCVCVCVRMCMLA